MAEQDEMIAGGYGFVDVLAGDGITLRDYYACIALRMMPVWLNDDRLQLASAAKAYRIADMMLEARKMDAEMLAAVAKSY